jgi:putative membrane protein
MIAKNNRQKKRPIESSSLEILNERYARGEIDDQEYSRRKKNMDL